MRKKKLKPIPASECWRQKLDMDYKTEFARYRFLCGHLPHKDYKLLGNTYYTTYSEWEYHIKTMLNKLTQEEAINFYHYLENCIRSNSLTSQTITTLFFPFILSLYLPVLTEQLIEIISVDKNITSPFRGLIIALVVLITFVIILAVKLLPDIKSDALKKHFYTDIQAIIKKKYPNLKL